MEKNKIKSEIAKYTLVLFWFLFFVILIRLCLAESGIV